MGADCIYEKMNSDGYPVSGCAMLKFESNKHNPYPSSFGNEDLNCQVMILFPGLESMEETVVTIPLICGVWHKISATVPASGLAPGNCMRLIPLGGPAVMTIASVNFVDKGLNEKALSIHEFGDENTFALKGTAFRLPSGENLVLLITGDQAALDIEVPAGLSDCPLQVDIWLKLSRDTDACHRVLQSLADLENWRFLLCTEGMKPSPRRVMNLAQVLEDAGCPDCADSVLHRGIVSYPEEALLYEAFAELAMRRGNWAEAVNRWQDVLALRGESTSDFVYRRLEEAYNKQKLFPLGTPEEESGAGEVSKYEILSFLHGHLAPELYLEIGVQAGKSLALADCEAVAVDPMPQIDLGLFENARIFPLKSDDFFKGPAVQLLEKKPDLVFIDGMHLFEYVLRDFMNVERFAAAHTLVVIDDIFPVHPAQAERRRKTRFWTGDVWKLYMALKEYRSDLFFLPINTFPTGLLLIVGLKPGNTVLSEKYNEIVKSYSVGLQPPEDILLRKGALSPTCSELQDMVEALKAARERKDDLEGVAAELRARRLENKRS